MGETRHYNKPRARTAPATALRASRVPPGSAQVSARSTKVHAQVRPGQGRREMYMRNRKRVVRAIRIGWWIAAGLPMAALQAQVPDACPAGEVTVAGRDNAGEAWRPDGIVTPSRDLGLPDPAVHDAVRAQ